MPTKTPLNAVIHGKIERPEYTVEKVYFESMPGFFVTGNLYRPKKITGKVARRPVRTRPLERRPALGVRATTPCSKEIAAGQERFERGRPQPIFNRCASSWPAWAASSGSGTCSSDSDSMQFPPELVHRFAKQRPEMNTTENWGLYSPQAEAHLQSIMGLQTWNSDPLARFLLSLPDVDPDAHRHDRRQRRRHANDDPRRDRSRA